MIRRKLCQNNLSGGSLEGNSLDSQEAPVDPKWVPTNSVNVPKIWLVVTICYDPSYPQPIVPTCGYLLRQHI